MDALDVSRWQFGITTVYHFIFVPLTIGLAPLIAAMQTAWHVTGNAACYRLTRFFGKLFLISRVFGPTATRSTSTCSVSLQTPSELAIVFHGSF